MPYIELSEILKEYPNVTEIKWVQEEHMNSGCWTYVQPRLNSVSIFSLFLFQVI